MRLILRLVLLVALAGGLTLAAQERPRSGVAGADEDVVHGTRVVDPFRALEHPDTTVTRDWLTEQERRLGAFLDAASVERFRKRLEALATYDTYSTPIRTRRGYFFSRALASVGTTGRRVYRSVTAHDDGRLVLDVQMRHGASATLGTFAPSPDGRRLAYVLHRDRSAWGEVRILSVEEPSGPEDVLPDVHRLSTLQWTTDARELIYTAFTRPASEGAPIGAQVVRRHRVGRPSREDVTIPVPDGAPALRFTTPRVTDDGRYAVLSTQQGTDQRAMVSVLDLRAAGAAPVSLVPAPTAAYTFLGSQGDRLWFYTDDGAPNGRVVQVRLGATAPQGWQTVVPEATDAIAARDQTGGNALGMFGGRLVLMYLKDGRPYLRGFDPGGRSLWAVDLPAAGSVWNGLVGRSDHPEVCFQFLGLTDPATFMAIDAASGALRVLRRAAVPFTQSDYVTTQEFYRSADGTRIPMFVVRRQGHVRDGRSPTLLFGYGALAWVSFVWYQPQLLAWLDMGGVYAQPSIRGGGEYGKAWHEAALRTRKQVAVDDYIAAAEFLIRERYTAPDRLVATGGSLSAPLAAAATAQRPTLFGAAVIDRPVTDLVRYERFSGAAFWTPEFGTVAARDEFEALHRLSPYHEALRGTCMPPTLVMTGEFDRTAPPLHGFKLVAARQSTTQCPAPTFLKLMRGATHDFGKTPQQVADSFAAELAFLEKVLKRVP